MTPHPSMHLVVVAALLGVGGCPLTGPRDGIGQPCVVDGEVPCAPDHVCRAADGALDGLCAPIVDYGRNCPPPTHSQRPGAIRSERLEVDDPAALALLEDVVRVEGDLVLDGPFTGPLLAVDPLCGLSGLQQVTGTLLIAQTNLQTLDGLQSLSYVGGGIGIAGNPSLVDLSALANVIRVDVPDDARFSIVIAENRSLPREALRGLKDALAERPSITIAACGNLAAAEENTAPACGVEINRFLRRE
jgi:hypothetical protein